MNSRAVTLIAERLPRGLVHPGDPDTNQPAKAVPLPGLSNLGIPPEMAAQFAAEAGLSNDVPKTIAEAIVHLLDTEGLEIIDRGELERLRAAAATPQEANTPVVQVRCQHTRMGQPLFTVATGRVSTMIDCRLLAGHADG